MLSGSQCAQCRQAAADALLERAFHTISDHALEELRDKLEVGGAGGARQGAEGRWWGKQAAQAVIYAADMAGR